VCACVREREKERETARAEEREGREDNNVQVFLCSYHAY
jgi:hypothetical protein